MIKTYAVVENGKVINVIIADDTFAQMYTSSTEHIGECFEYQEVHEDDGFVARIGDDFIGGMFITPSSIPSVPQSITRIQAMKVMKSMGLWDTFKAVIASNQDAQDEWDLAIQLDRGNEFVTALMPVLNLTSEQLDELFIQASKL